MTVSSSGFGGDPRGWLLNKKIPAAQLPVISVDHHRNSPLIPSRASPAAARVIAFERSGGFRSARRGSSCAAPLENPKAR